jgi:PAS domain S-box-containing protein
LTASAAEIDAGLLPMRLRLHRRALLTAQIASAGMALMLFWVLWSPATCAPLATWLAAWAGVQALRLLVNRLNARSAAPNTPGWLRLHRVGFALHGLVWAGAVLLPLERPGDTLLLGFVLTGMAAGALMLAAFDISAGLLFAGPPALVLAVGVLQQSEMQARTLGIFALLFLGITLLATLRAQQASREGARLRQAQAQREQQAQQDRDRAEQALRQLADQHHLLTQLMQTTHQGFWFLDNEGLTRDLNPAMAALLGRPREEVLGRSVFDFFADDDLGTVRREIERRWQGVPGSYEVGLQRPDGTRLHCVNHATPLYDAEGRRTGSVGLFTDITLRREAEARLRTYELVVNSITDIVSVADANAVYRMVNDAWCRATGVPREQALGRRSVDALPSAVSPERQRALSEAIRTGQPRMVRGAGRLPAAPDRLVETTYYPYADESVGLRFVAMVSRDITEQEHTLQRLRASEAELRSLLMAFPGYIASVDKHHIYTYVNERLADALGRPASTMIGRSIQEVLGAQRATEVTAALEQAAGGQAVVAERRYIHAGTGQRLDLEVTHVVGPAQPDGQRTGYGFGIDITARKRAEEGLIAARDEAERANRAKSQFLAQMSHELRTPLNAILGFGQLLESDAERVLSESQRGQVREILRGARHLLALINELLDLGRIEAGNLRLDTEPVPLAELADECLAMMQALAAELGVQLLPPEGCAPALLVQADRTRLRQVLLNLLGNAIKYNHRGGSVALSCSVRGEGAAAQVRLSVQDTGIGFSESERARLFQPFERLGAADSGIEGTGIGLALSRHLVENMGGEIGAQSQPGQGSLFWVQLPLAGAPASAAALPAPPQPGPAPAAEAPPRTVLYIEDNPVNVVLMEAMLLRLPGLRVLSAALPETGLALALAERPDLILLDIQLPGMSGLQVLARLRELAATKAIPVVAVSANAVPEDIQAARAAGFDDYLTKPLDLPQLLATVQQLLWAAPDGSVKPA